MAKRKPKPNSMAVLRDLLSQEPSEKVWKDLLDVTLKVDPEEWKQTIEPWLLAHLDNAWDDEMRSLLPGWTRRLNMGKRPQGISLIATINWGGRISKPKLKKRLEDAEMPSLRHFSCIYSYASAAGLKYLLELPALQNLEYLDLSYNEFKTRGIRHLLNSPLTRRLKHLVLNGNQLFQEEADIFVELGDFDSLEVLELRNCFLMPEVWERLAESRMIQNLKVLRLDNHNPGLFENDLDPDLLKVFEKHSFPRLEKLDIRRNYVYGTSQKYGKKERSPLFGVKPSDITPTLQELLWF